MDELPPGRVERSSIPLDRESENPAPQPKEKRKPKPAPQDVPEIAEEDEETHELDTLA
jgi:hypothetical protein